MKRIITLYVLLSCFNLAQASVLSLDSCFALAIRNYPLLQENKLVLESLNNEIKADNKSWLPKASFIAKASYQSEVVEFAGLSFPKDNYLSAIDLEQTLFDAGQNKQQKKIARANSENDAAKNEVELYKLIDRVNQLYSSILLTRANINALQLYSDDIANKKLNLQASVKNGLALNSSLQELEAEELKTQQSQTEASDNLTALYQTLGTYINSAINDSTQLSSEAEMSQAATENTIRPEFKLFDTQKRLLEERHKLSNKICLPHVSVSAEGAYGRPGPNFLNQDLRFFGIAAVNLKWNVGNLYTLSNERQSSEIGKKRVDVQKEIFELNQRNQLTSQFAQISSLKNMMLLDKQIIEKRHDIRTTASIQLENGTITTTDYLNQLNAEMQAVLNEKVHEIKLMNAIANYNATKGSIKF